MSHIIYKAKERYSFGWSDPRAMLSDGLNDLSVVRNQEIKSWTIEQLRNAWLVRFGSGWVPFKELSECGDNDYMDIGIMLDREMQLEKIHTPDQFFPSYRLTQCK